MFSGISQNMVKLLLKIIFVREVHAQTTGLQW